MNPILSYRVEKRRDHRNLPSANAISVIPPLLSTTTNEGGGGDSPKKKFRLVSITAKCRLTHFPPKFAHFFCTCHNFFPLSSVQIIIIPAVAYCVCLRWYVKSLYRHFFLEDIAKHARVILKKWHLPNGKMSNSQAPWATDSKFVLWLANTLSCDMAESYLQRGEVLNRYETLYFQPRQNPRNICDPASFNHYISGTLHGKKKLSQLYPSLVLWEATTQVWGL